MGEPIFTPEFSKPFRYALRHPIRALMTVLAIMAILAAIAAVFAAPLVLGGQALRWLKFGVWPRWSTEDVYHWFGQVPAKSDWVGVQKLLNLYFELPASVGLFISGVAVLWFGIWLITEIDKHGSTVDAGKRAKP